MTVSDAPGDFYVSSAPTEPGTWSGGGLSGDPSGVSCIAGQCVVVAGSDALWTTDPENGGEAQFQTDAADSTGNTLTGISCPSAAFCVAVDAQGNVVWSDEPAGGTWTVTNIAGADDVLEDVSCASASLCVAVDAGGSVWVSTDPTAGASAWIKSGVDSNALTGISCASANLCVAVDDDGNAVVSDLPTGRASNWVAAQVDSAGSPLAGVSCSSPYDCVISDNVTDAGGSVIVGKAVPLSLTGQATDVSSTSATLNATVDPEDRTTNCWFEWGTSAAFGNAVPCAEEPGSGVNAVSVSAQLSGLSANTTYRYRIVSRNAGGRNYGVDRTFTTPASAPIVTTGSATGVSQNTATLNATVDPAGGDLSDCHFEYAAAGGDDESIPCSQTVPLGQGAVAVSATPTDLLANTSYTFWIVAANGDGPSSGGDGTFSTLPNAPVVTVGSATDVSQTAATLSGTVDPQGGALSACEFDYWTSGGSMQSVECSQTPDPNGGPTPVSADVSGLSANTTYSFQIVATNTGGTSDGAGTFTTLPNAPVVAAGSVTDVSQMAATLNATVDPQGGALSDCEFDYSTGAGPAQSAPCAQTPDPNGVAAPVDADLSGLSPNSAYSFEIVATNAGGTSSDDSGTFATPPNPPAVTTGSPTDVSQTVATFNGTFDPQGGAVLGCHFDYGTTTDYDQTTPCASGSPAGTASATPSGLLPNTTYHYRLVVINAGGTSPGEDQTFTTPPNPPALNDQSASGVTQQGATLNATVDLEGGNLSSCQFDYGVTTQYGQTAPCSQAADSSASPTLVTADLSNLLPDTTYHYRAVVTNGGGTTEGPDQTFTTPAVSSLGGQAEPVVTVGPPQVLSGATAGFTGTVNPEGLPTTAYFQFTIDPSYFGGGPLVYNQSTPVQTVGADSTVHQISVQVVGLVPDAIYHVRLVASSTAGTVMTSGETFTTTKDPTPPQPQIGQTANLVPVTGFVLIKPPNGFSYHAVGHEVVAGAPPKGEGFVPLTQVRQVPIGSEIDSTRGTLNLFVNNGKTHHTQRAHLKGGIYKVTQVSHGPHKGLTTFALKEGAFTGAPSFSACTAKSKTAAETASVPHSKKPSLSSKILQTLRASDNGGKFQTKGKYSSATVRGTDWGVMERCDGDLTVVHRGVVDVLDFHTRKTVTLHAGQSFFAPAPTGHGRLAG